MLGIHKKEGSSLQQFLGTTNLAFDSWYTLLSNSHPFQEGVLLTPLSVVLADSLTPIRWCLIISPGILHVSIWIPHP